MTEHRHSWRIITKMEYAGASHRAQAWCPECKMTLEKDEIEARLNATEALSAEDARSISFLVREPNIDTSTLDDYARRLEDETG